MKKIIHEHLLQLGAPANLLGFEYATSAVEIILDDPSAKYNLHGDIYPALADQYDTTEEAVARSLRYIVQTAFKRCNPEYNADYFKNSVSPDRVLPTVSEFLATIAMHIADNTQIEKVRDYE